MTNEETRDGLLVVLQQLLTGHNARVVLGVTAAQGVLQALELGVGYAVLELEVDEVRTSHVSVTGGGTLVFCLRCLQSGFAEAGATNEDSLIGGGAFKAGVEQADDGVFGGLVSTGGADGFHNVGAGDLAVQREVMLLREVGRDHDFTIIAGDFTLHLVREEARIGGQLVVLHAGFLVAGADRTRDSVLHPVSGEQVALFYFLNLVTSQVDRGAVLTVAGRSGGGDDRLGAREHVTNGGIDGRLQRVSEHHNGGDEKG